MSDDDVHHRKIVQLLISSQITVSLQSCQDGESGMMRIRWWHWVRGGVGFGPGDQGMRGWRGSWCSAQGGDGWLVFSSCPADAPPVPSSQCPAPVCQSWAAGNCWAMPEPLETPEGRCSHLGRQGASFGGGWSWRNQFSLAGGEREWEATVVIKLSIQLVQIFRHQEY